MKAVLYHKKNLPNRLTYSDIPKPIITDDEVLVKIVCVSPNAADYRSMKMGITPKKKIFGSAISGIIELVGKNIQNLKPGDAVLGDLADIGFGGFAEYVAVPENSLILKPEEITFEQAATLPVAATTALKAMHKGDVKQGQKVLIIGGGGGVGTFAIQLACYFGAEVTAVCSTKNIQQSLSLGADFVIDYTKEDFTKDHKQYDVIIAINGNYPLLACKRLLTKRGKFIMVGGALSQIFKTLLFGWCLSLGTKKIRAVFGKSNLKNLEFVVDLMKKGKITAVIEKQYTFEEIPDVIHYMSQGHAKGKLVIKTI